MSDRSLAPPSLSSRAKPVVLIVDDDELVRLTLAAAIEEAGFDVRLESNGADALTRYSEDKPDIVILDVVMPTLDGFEACEALRLLPSAEFLPIVMLTGQHDTESIERAYQVGATDFITKPVSFSLLSHRLRYILRATRTLQQLRDRETQLASAQRLARLGSWAWDLRDNVVTISDAAVEILGLEMLPGHRGPERLLATVHPDEREHVELQLRRAEREHQTISFEHRTVDGDGAERVIQQEAVWTEDVNGERKLVGTVLDITERRKAERRILELAFYDELTRLPNRTFFREHTDRVLPQLERSGRSGAVLSLDLDGFKQVNDAFGHAAGDDLLKAVADRLSERLRASDCVTRSSLPATVAAHHADVTVARFGGDEFTVLLNDIDRDGDAGLVAQRILEAFDRPFPVESKEIFVTASIGIAIFPKDGADTETLLKRADQAMYHSKSSGRDRFQFYSDALDSKARESLVLASRLRTALRDDAMRMVFQPKLEMENGRVVGCEALMRWHDAELGQVSPGDFIPVAEATGLIVPLGKWALRAVCEQSASWRDAGAPSMPIAVNVSGRQLKEERFVDDIQDCLSEFALDPSSLEIEITEWVLVEENDANVRVLSELDEMGIRVTLDDFGTGYSSLSYLKRFPIGTIKIDRSFVLDMTTDPDSAALVTTIVALAESMGINVVAEGVETHAQLDFLKRSGCREAQGYLFSRPLPGDELLEWCRVTAAGAAESAASR